MNPMIDVMHITMDECKRVNQHFTNMDQCSYIA